MATKAEIEAHIAVKLRSVYAEAINGSYVQSSISGTMDAAAWNAIADWIKTNNLGAIGDFVAQKVRTKVIEDASTEAATMLVNDQLSLVEYSRLERLP